MMSTSPGTALSSATRTRVAPDSADRSTSRSSAHASTRADHGERGGRGRGQRRGIESRDGSMGHATREPVGARGKPRPWIGRVRVELVVLGRACDREKVRFRRTDRMRRCFAIEGGEERDPRGRATRRTFVVPQPKHEVLQRVDHLGRLALFRHDARVVAPTRHPLWSASAKKSGKVPIRKMPRTSGSPRRHPATNARPETRGRVVLFAPRSRASHDTPSLAAAVCDRGPRLGAPHRHGLPV